MPAQSLRDGAAAVAPRSRPRRPAHRVAARASCSARRSRSPPSRAYEMYLVLAVGGMTPLEAIILALFVVLFAWIALSFASTLVGLVALCGGRPRARHRSRCAAAEDQDPHRAAAADLQRAAGPGVLAVQAMHGNSSPRPARCAVLRRVHPERHHRSATLHRGGSRLPRAARAAREHGRSSTATAPKNDRARRRATSPNGCGASAAPTQHVGGPRRGQR